MKQIAQEVKENIEERWRETAVIRYKSNNSFINRNYSDRYEYIFKYTFFDENNYCAISNLKTGCF